jgi:hypothetical protein
MHLTFSEDGLFEPRHGQLRLIVDLQAGTATLLQMPNKRLNNFFQIVITNTWLIKPSTLSYVKFNGEFGTFQCLF